MTDSEPAEDADASEDSETDSGKPNSKVARVIERYGLEGLGADMEAMWQGQSGSRKSLRELAAIFNSAVIEAAMEEVGLDPLPGEIEDVHEAMKSDDVSGGQRREIRGKLEREGIDFDELGNDLVTYQAIRTYLKKYRGVETPSQTTDPVEDALSTVNRLSGRLQVVTDQRLDQLANADHLDIGDHRVLVNVQVYCDSCGRQYDVATLLDRGGCHCSETNE